MKRRNLSAYNYTGYFFIGFIYIMFAPVLPFIIKEFGLSLALAGAIFPARAGGTFIGTIAGGLASDFLGRKPIIIIGSLIMALSMFFISASGSWAYILAFFVLAGIGVGMLNTTLNALTSDINIDRRGPALNLLHGVYAIGSLLGPIAAGYILNLGYNWRLIFYVSSAIWLIYGLTTILIKYPAIKTDKNKNNFKIKSGFMFSPVVILLIFVVFIYNGTANSLIGWVNTYMDKMNYTVLLGSSMVSIFYLGLTAGRFISGALSDKIGYSKVILFCSLGSFLFFPLAVFSNNPWFIAIGVLLTGLFNSGLYPTSLAWANTLFPNKAGTITAILSTFNALGAMTIPWLTGIVADKMGFKAGLGIGCLFLLILVPVAITLIKLKKTASQKI